ncbi:hypothetical protein [Stieleria mannarensis]|uniref:hypothetical protein n=1 Tax=Stieleria mannarensis TaxID=2755585 RepID=UPI0016029F89|nr:hypothetical protein [Rhodopirellula sp. JC639]
MRLWAAKRWGARIRKHGEESWIDLKQPFALVGSDPNCDVQIGDSKLPPVVYLVVACGDRIEVWPTCPLAFPIWGRVSKNHVLMVGKARIQFYFKDDHDEIGFSQESDLDDDSADVTQEPGDHRRFVGGGGIFGAETGDGDASSDALPAASLILDWGRGPRRKSLSRNVSIMGEDHPSLIRLHNADLERCDHGIVCFDQDVWLIELHPERLGSNGSLIRRIRPGDRSVVIGGIHLWVEGAEPLDTERLVKSAGPDGKDATTASPTAHGGGGLSANSVGNPGTAEASAAASSSDARRIAVVESTSHDEAESITMELTARLLETNARKSFRRRLMKIAGISGLVVLAVVGVSAILIWGMLPMVRAIYGP